MSRLLTLYTQLLKTIEEKQTYFSEEDLSVFNFAKGSSYSAQLLVVGRATNKWNRFEKRTLSLNTSEIVQNLKGDDLQWVIDNCETKTEYNPKRSAFWRVSTRLISYFHPGNEYPINCLGWTNLYKVSNAEGPNPSNRLCDVQLDLCIAILLEEIKILNPKYIVFLTGWGFAKWFLEKMPVTDAKVYSNSQFIEYSGRIKDSKFIVGQHPQGKPEDSHYREIISELKML